MFLYSECVDILMQMILIYMTNPTEEEARRIARHLLDRRLIACGNIFQTDSIYRWKEKIKDEKEFVLIAKTRPELYEKVRAEVEAIHSYDCPCIIRIDADANPAYIDWVLGQTGNPRNI